MPDHCQKFLEFNFFFLGGVEQVATETLQDFLLQHPGLEAAAKRMSLLSSPACSQTLKKIPGEKKNVAFPNIPSLDTIPQS